MQVDIMHGAIDTPDQGIGSKPVSGGLSEASPDVPSAEIGDKLEASEEHPIANKDVQTECNPMCDPMALMAATAEAVPASDGTLATCPADKVLSNTELVSEPAQHAAADSIVATSLAADVPHNKSYEADWKAMKSSVAVGDTESGAAMRDLKEGAVARDTSVPLAPQPDLGG
jgi:hypothetical protein